MYDITVNGRVVRSLPWRWLAVLYARLVALDLYHTNIAVHHQHTGEEAWSYGFTAPWPDC